MFEKATVTVTVGELQAFESELKAAKDENIRLTEALHKASLDDVDGKVRLLRDLADCQLDIVRFAVGNLHPLTVRGWPYKSLRRAIDLLREIPGKPLPLDLLHALDYCYAGIEKWEQAREAGTEQALHAEENASKAVSPAFLRGLGLLGPELPAGPVTMPEYKLPDVEEVVARDPTLGTVAPVVTFGTPDPA